MSASSSWRHPVPPILDSERLQRLERLRRNMASAGITGLLLGSTQSLRYFTGLVWHASERLCGALVTADRLIYVVPGFERSRVETLPRLDAEIATWEEDEEPASLVADLLGPKGTLALDGQLPLFLYHRLAEALGPERLVDGSALIANLRMRKSAAEIALIQYAMGLTLDVHRVAHAAMKPGVKTSEIVSLIDAEHRKRGADDGSSFCVVSFGTATSLPHGAEGDQVLNAGDLILVDTGCHIDGYCSDLTRTYTLDEPSPEIARIWAIEREAQQAVFDAARIGAPCEALDAAARRVIEAHGLGPDYRVPGLPHRAGHGLGLDIHEEPYIVRGNGTLLEAGMCFSNEPMILVPDAFGVRLEDHIVMTESGPRWFTQPSTSPTKPFG
ncbi:M24 family metallopeptidase [Microvirga solisilvae]|uniref:M24 family metallopeptidase n=1 Tax=Microvirga solisilvae TaxID=2919498 RepID=UPI001FAEA46C|nr:Xaa-Pro peptidase family protein [Microvirga solisilvae]